MPSKRYQDNKPRRFALRLRGPGSWYWLPGPGSWYWYLVSVPGPLTWYWYPVLGRNIGPPDLGNDLEREQPPELRTTTKSIEKVKHMAL